jgi:hypothetical protein
MNSARQSEVISIPKRRIFVVYPSGIIKAVPCKAYEVLYPDRRIAPRKCKATNMRRDYCCCTPCRVLRRRNHRAQCHCWLCFADRMGCFIDDLAKKTRAGRWQLFLTLTYRTNTFPWARGFPMAQPQPNSDFVRNFIGFMIRHLETELADRVEYFQAEQFGSVGGRLRQHVGLSSPGLEQAALQLEQNVAANKRDLPIALKPFQAFLWDKAGFNRILPWEKDAGHYVGRYIGRKAQHCDWDWKVGESRPSASVPVVPIGRVVVAASPELESKHFRNILRRRHR